MFSAGSPKAIHPPVSQTAHIGDEAPATKRPRTDFSRSVSAADSVKRSVQSHPVPLESRQRKVAVSRESTETQENSAGLQVRNGCCFVGAEVAHSSDFMPPPDSEARRVIDQFQKDNLEVCSGAVHNRGVFLKKDSVPVAAGQVVAIYRGQNISLRTLTPSERRLCGYPESESMKQLIWVKSEGVPELWQRPANYQAHAPHITYRDRNHRKVYPGVDAIDSRDAISHINSQQETDNIELVICLNPDLIQSSTEKSTDLKRKPDAHEYCFLAVANKEILPGSELLMDYGSNHGQRGHFWAPDQYFFQPLCPERVSVSFSADGASAWITAVPDHQKKEDLLSIRQFIEKELEYRSRVSIDQLVYILRLSYKNPFTGDANWHLGDAQYLCERWNKKAYTQGNYLSYLYHCLNRDGKLDNNGINYIHRFIASVKYAVDPPAGRPESMDDVIQWLQLCLEKRDKQSVQKPSDPVNKELQKQLQILEALQCRLMPEGDLKNHSLQRQREKVLTYLQDLQEPFGSRLRASYDTCHRLTSRFLTPGELWPDTFRSTLVWHPHHIRCAARLNNPAAEVDPLDRLNSYHFNSQEYTHALREALRGRQKEGASLEGIRTTINSGGLLSGQKGCTGDMDENEQGIEEGYRIPCLEGIPEPFWGTSFWLQLSPEHWHLLGYEQTGGDSLKSDDAVDDEIIDVCNEESAVNNYGPEKIDLIKLRNVIEKKLGTKHCLQNAARSVCRDTLRHRSLWVENPAIKPAVKEDKTGSLVLFKHLANKASVKLPEKPSDQQSSQQSEQQWQPLDTLRVCLPDSRDYRNAMQQLLHTSVAEGCGAMEIAVLLSTPLFCPKGSEEYKRHYRVELPESLVSKGYISWTAEAVKELLENFGLTELVYIDPVNRLKSLVAHSTLSQGVNNIYTIGKRLREVFERHPEIAETFADTLYIQRHRLDALSSGTIRLIFNSLNIEVVGDKLKDELKLKQFDKISGITSQHPEWVKEVISLIAFYRSKGRSDQEIADNFNRGACVKKHELVFDPIPILDVCRTERWTAEAVKNLGSLCFQAFLAGVAVDS